MKKLKLITALLALIITVSVNAQAKPQKQAQKIADEMTEVLSLSKQESKAIYKIQLERFKEGESIKKEYSNQPEVRKEKLNKLGGKLYNQLKDYLGMERLKEWRTYKKNKN